MIEDTQEIQDKNALDHYRLQEVFARRAMKLIGESLETSLLKYTAFYKRIGNSDWKFDTSKPEWRSFIDRVENGESVAEVVLELNKLKHSPEIHKLYFGCFRFDYDDKDKSVTLHFQNNDETGLGPLSSARIGNRLGDLKAMFRHIAKEHPEAKVVKGGSWLYNYQSYRRLFPSKYTENMRVEEVPFPRSMGIWGQFLDSKGGLNQERVEGFTQKINEAKNIDELLSAIPFKILYPKCEIKEFYDFYGIELVSN